jgi:hypothetical protein
MDSIQLEGFTSPKAGGKIEIIIHTVKSMQENRFCPSLLPGGIIFATGYLIYQYDIHRKDSLPGEKDV